MSKKKADKLLSKKLEAEYGYLFDRPSNSSETKTEDAQKLLNEKCIIKDGRSVCRVDGVWFVC